MTDVDERLRHAASTLRDQFGDEPIPDLGTESRGVVGFEV
jgi:hypothetical protein